MKMATELCVVSLNCWGIKFVSDNRVARISAIADELASGKYDFALLQEVWTHQDYQVIQKRVKDVLPYSHYFFSGVIGAGICIFSMSKIKNSFFHRWAVNGYMHKVQHGDWFGGKGIGMIEVVHKGLKIHLYTTHLHAEYNRENDEYLAHRVVQAFDTAEFIELTSRDADLVILGGDFNTEPDDVAYKVLVTIPNLKDCVYDLDKANPTEIMNTCETPRNSYTPEKSLKSNAHGKRIDYICFKSSNGFKAKTISCEIPWPSRVPNEKFSYSDHEAVVAKIHVSKSIEDEPPASPTPASEQAKKALVEQCIEIVVAAIRNMEYSKKAYRTLFFAMNVLLFFSYYIDFPGVFSIVMTTIRTLVVVLILFSLIMSTIWNRMEVNGLLCGLGAMQLEYGMAGRYFDTPDENVEVTEETARLSRSSSDEI